MRNQCTSPSGGYAKWWSILPKYGSRTPVCGLKPKTRYLPRQQWLRRKHWSTMVAGLPELLARSLAATKLNRLRTLPSGVTTTPTPSARPLVRRRRCAGRSSEWHRVRRTLLEHARPASRVPNAASMVSDSISGPMRVAAETSCEPAGGPWAGEGGLKGAAPPGFEMTRQPQGPGGRAASL